MAVIITTHYIDEASQANKVNRKKKKTCKYFPWLRFIYVVLKFNIFFFLKHKH